MLPDDLKKNAFKVLGTIYILALKFANLDSFFKKISTVV